MRFDHRLTRDRGGGRWSVVVEQQVDTPLHEPPIRIAYTAAALR